MATAHPQNQSNNPEYNSSKPPVDDNDVDLIMTSQDHNEGRNAKQEKALKLYKGIKTGVYLSVWASFGITFCLMGATLPDLLHRIGIDNERYGLLKIVENVIAAIFGLSAGIMVDRIQHKSDLIISIALMCLGIGQIALPWCRNQYTALFVWIVLNAAGFTAGTTGTGYMIAMWGEKAKLPIHLMYIGFPLGCTFGPLLAKPFISEQNQDLDSNSHSTPVPHDEGYLLTTSSSINNTHVSHEYHIGDSSIEVPYGISGGFLLVLSAIFMAFYLNWVKTPEGFELHRQPHKSLKDALNPKLWNSKHPYLAVAVFCLLVIFYMLLDAIEGPLTNVFLFTYAVKGQYKFTSSNAALLDFSFKASMLLGRLVIIPISFFVNIKIMIFAELILSFAMSVCLATLGTHSATEFWVFLCLLNFALAPLWPGGFAWANRYVVLYTSMIALCDVFIRIADGLFSWLVGYIIDKRDPNDMWYLLSASFGAMLLLFTIAQLVANRAGERFTSIPEVQVDETGLLQSDDDDDNDILSDSHLELDVIPHNA